MPRIIREMRSRLKKPTRNARTVKESLEPDGGEVRPIQRERHRLLRRDKGGGWEKEEGRSGLPRGGEEKA